MKTPRNPNCLLEFAHMHIDYEEKLLEFRCCSDDNQYL